VIVVRHSHSCGPLIVTFPRMAGSSARCNTRIEPPVASRFLKPYAAALALLAIAALAGCNREVEQRAVAATGGDPSRGPALVRQYGCNTCHTISGVRGADGLVGPPLDRIGARVYLAGALANTPANLIRWIRDPRGVDANTAMPNVGVGEQDARDIAAYLYTLR
jgi:cytochrome c